MLTSHRCGGKGVGSCIQVRRCPIGKSRRRGVIAIEEFHRRVGCSIRVLGASTGTWCYRAFVAIFTPIQSKVVDGV